MHICALKIPQEDALEVYPQVDTIRGEMLEPCSGAFREVGWQVLDDEEIIVCPDWLTGKAEVFQPCYGVGVLGVFGDVQRHVETC